MRYRYLLARWKVLGGGHMSGCVKRQATRCRLAQSASSTTHTKRGRRPHNAHTTKQTTQIRHRGDCDCDCSCSASSASQIHHRAHQTTATSGRSERSGMVAQQPPLQPESSCPAAAQFITDPDPVLDLGALIDQQHTDRGGADNISVAPVSPVR